MPLFFFIQLRTFNSSAYQNVDNYHLLNEFGGYVLAAKLKSDDSLEFVTWHINYDRTAVHIGHYFSGYDEAKENFAVRSGLVDRHKMFNETELKLIYQGLIRYAVDFQNLTSEQLSSIDKMVGKIETILPEVQEQEEYRYEEFLPDNGLSL